MSRVNSAEHLVVTTTTPNDSSSAAVATAVHSSVNSDDSVIQEATGSSIRGGGGSSRSMLRKRKGAGVKSPPKLDRQLVRLAVPDLPPRHRSRRRPDEILEDWERSDGKFSVTCPKRDESGVKSVTTHNIRVLALSCPKMVNGAISLYPSGPRIYTFAEPLAGCPMGLLFLPPHRGLSPEDTRDTHLHFYVVSGKVLVNMRLYGLGGKKARFGVNKGGMWEVPRNTTFSMVNGLSMDAHLVFWRISAAAAAAAAAAAGESVRDSSAAAVAPC